MVLTHTHTASLSIQQRLTFSHWALFVPGMSEALNDALHRMNCQVFSLYINQSINTLSTLSLGESNALSIALTCVDLYVRRVDLQRPETDSRRTIQQSTSQDFGVHGFNAFDSEDDEVMC